MNMKNILTISFFLGIYTFPIIAQDTVKIHKQKGKYYFEYTISPKENLYKISKKYSIKIPDIKNINVHLQENSLKKGEKIYIPFRAKKAKRYGLIFHYIVSEGDNLYRISKIFDMDKAHIMHQNQLITEILPVGKSLIINFQLESKKEDSNISSTSISAAPKTIEIDSNFSKRPSETIIYTHIVQKGETLYFIAKKYGIEVDNLKKWNNIQENRLSVDQRLLIKTSKDISRKSSVPSVLDKKKGKAVCNESIKSEKTINRKLAFHRHLPEGSYIKVVNKKNEKSTLVRVVGKSTVYSSNSIIIELSPQACEELGAEESFFEVELIYNL